MKTRVIELARGGHGRDELTTAIDKLSTPDTGTLTFTGYVAISHPLDRTRARVTAPCSWRVEARQLALSATDGMSANEFQVFSQWGEDGIIQYLLRHIDVGHRFFVEFGVEDYWESNTRFLLTHNNWEGLVMDSSHKHITAIKGQQLYWRRTLTAVEALITQDNITLVSAERGAAGVRLW